MRASINNWEWHNLIRKNGEIFVRPGFFTVNSITGTTSYVGGFTVESPNTSEPWHYLFEQTDVGATTLRVFTEEFSEIFNLSLGVLPKRPVITHAVVNRQLMINSPAFSQPLYGLVGGGLIPAIKTASQNPDTTAIDIPTGHIAAFGDRMVIAQGSTLYFNDPGIDPRTFTAENTIAAPGTIYDLFQGPDGALYVFTSGEAMVIPQDALGKGQNVSGFVSTIPGLDILHPRNACVSNGVVAVLSADGVVLVNRGMKHIPLTTYRGKRSFALPVTFDDAREYGELFATPGGFVVGFSDIGYFFDINLKQDYTSCNYVASFTSIAPQTPLRLCGMLSGRGGETLLVAATRVFLSAPGFITDFGNYTVKGMACGYAELGGEASAVLRYVMLTTDASSFSGDMQAGGTIAESDPDAAVGDIVIGTSVWGTSSYMRSRQPRTVRFEFNYRASQFPIEMRVAAGGARLGSTIDLKVVGQGRGRADVE